MKFLGHLIWYAFVAAFAWSCTTLTIRHLENAESPKWDSIPGVAQDVRPQGGGFETQDAAALAGLQDIILINSDFEYAGAVYYCGDAFYRSNIVTSEQPHGVDYVVVTPPSCNWKAGFHSHPHSEIDSFSDTDVGGYRAAGVDGYIWSRKAGVIRYWTRGDDLTGELIRYVCEGVLVTRPTRCQ